MGPIGTALAAHLIEAGAFVVLCDVDREKIDQMKDKGILLENLIEKEVGVTETCYSVQDLGRYDLDLVAISVKTPVLKQVVGELDKSGLYKAFVMCAQNGLDNEMEAAEVVGEGRTLRMVVNYAGGMSAPNTMHVIFFNPPNYVAALAPQGEAMAATVAEMLSSVGLATEVPDNIQHYTWEKAILNAALAPVCAITGLTMREVTENPTGMGLVKAILEESIAVAEAEGHTYGDDFLEFCTKYLKAGGYHRPSMLVDLDNGLLTEIDRMNGRIAEYGRQHGMPVPVNETITALVHLMEKRTK
ncbi:MAG: ketopantoate reductase family protein [Candidatus Zixiibacteriota bacterium]|nr:MAG: ketopantoate reductase family protein [candidate division Zixibacteria bacterium]